MIMFFVPHRLASDNVIIGHLQPGFATLGDGIGFHMPFIFAGHSVGGRAEKLLPRSAAVRRCIERQQHICIRPFLF